MSILLVLILLIGTGCSSVRYYSQAVSGQWSLLVGATSTEKLLDNPSTDQALRTQLEKAQAYLAFAKANGLPVGSSYTKYVDLGRPFVVWNVFASQPFSTALLEQCFPIAGCVGYKGYFNEEHAKQYAQQLREQGLDVFVGGVAAYSTLGWFDDPLLNTFVFRTDERLAAVIFHELAHKVLYLPGDTVFNESFATTVERHLLREWLQSQNRQPDYERYLAGAERRQQVIALILDTRQKLSTLYQSNVSDQQKQTQKDKTILELRAAYRQLQASWQAGNEFSFWIEQDLNNAHLAAIGAYQGFVPAFTKMLEESENLSDFFERVEVLSNQSESIRQQQLVTNGD